MAKLPKVHLIFATDASQELARLLQILQNFKSENRIREFSTLEFISTTATHPNTPTVDDLILILLSKGLKSKIPELEKFLEVLKPKAAGIKLVVIKVDDVEWENKYLTFPLDLSALNNHPQPEEAFQIFPEDRKALREREDWEQPWNQIEGALKSLFSQKKDQLPSSGPGKRLKILLPILVLILAVIIFFLMQNGGTDPIAGENDLFWDEANWDESQWQ